MLPPALPSWIAQVTAPFEAPLTVAVNASVRQASTVALAGAIVTDTGAGDPGGGAGGAVTVAVPSATAFGSATLATSTWQTAAAEGAEYTPDAPMLPQPEGSRIDQVTESFFVPVTLAVNTTVPPAPTATALGDTEIAMWPTLTFAAPSAPALTLLDARTVYSPTASGAT